ncbi:hypothetical protein [Actinospica robiniae]|uniref:hypothetical protein n=1 Tax=Actinospica robiniae TaxID=304901 RepID=UPI0003FD6D72|nr:hypothetical protein [Actinospica robiniae]
MLGDAVSGFWQRIPAGRPAAGALRAGGAESGRPVAAEPDEGAGRGSAGPMFVRADSARAALAGDQPPHTCLDQRILKRANGFRQLRAGRPRAVPGADASREPGARAAAAAPLRLPSTGPYGA